ncbi:hypothetical protein NPIL_538051 [Nephila pilipes]|uniref:Uncharacterized protein n=1 Tax=Nephila pilipes TaxID=299642 RepID=A0A8X6MWK2_NEPPI|nr:hypothetical protein NPIL_538051 [Nephila pilipes]
MVFILFLDRQKVTENVPFQINNSISKDSNDLLVHRTSIRSNNTTNSIEIEIQTSVPPHVRNKEENISHTADNLFSKKYFPPIALPVILHRKRRNRVRTQNKGPRFPPSLNPELEKRD